MPSDKRIRWFEDILDNIARIERFTAGLDLQGFATDEQATFAVLLALGGPHRVYADGAKDAVIREAAYG